MTKKGNEIKKYVGKKTILKRMPANFEINFAKTKSFE